MWLSDGLDPLSSWVLVLGAVNLLGVVVLAIIRTLDALAAVLIRWAWSTAAKRTERERLDAVVRVPSRQIPEVWR